MTFWLKGCPRCAADLQKRPDITGPYVACVQCGFELPSAPPIRSAQRLPAGRS